jgi:hypothetical protein
MPLWVGEVPLIGGVALLPLLPDPLPFPAKVLIAPGKKPEGVSCAEAASGIRSNAKSSREQRRTQRQGNLESARKNFMRPSSK